jgi:hypothetical protein
MHVIAIGYGVFAAAGYLLKWELSNWAIAIWRRSALPFCSHAGFAVVGSFTIGFERFNLHLPRWILNTVASYMRRRFAAVFNQDRSRDGGKVSVV